SCFFFQAEDGIRDFHVTGVQTCALPIYIDNKIFHPIYLLSGEEPYYIDLLSDYIAEHALSEEEQSFNQTIVYGKDSEVQSIIQKIGRASCRERVEISVVVVYVE